MPVPFFFEGAPGKIASDGSAPSPAYVNEFISSSEGLRLIGAFIRIDKDQVRRRILALVQELVGNDGGPD